MQIPNTVPPLRPLLSHRWGSSHPLPAPPLSLLLSRCVYNRSWTAESSSSSSSSSPSSSSSSLGQFFFQWNAILFPIRAIPDHRRCFRETSRFLLQMLILSAFLSLSLSLSVGLSLRSWKEPAPRTRERLGEWEKQEFFLRALFSRIFDSIIFAEEFCFRTFIEFAATLQRPILSSSSREKIEIYFHSSWMRWRKF